MEKLNTHIREGSQASSAKEHFLAWDKEYSHLKWGGPASTRSFQVYLLPGSRVLDAGSGNGRYLGELARYYTVVGVDISLLALRSSRAQLARSGRFANISEQVSTNFLSRLDLMTEFYVTAYFSIFSKKKERQLLWNSGAYSIRAVLFSCEAFGCEDMRCGGDFSPL